MLIRKLSLTYGRFGKGALVKVSQVMVMMMIMIIIMIIMRMRRMFMHFSRVEEKVVTPAGIAFSHKSWSYCRARTPFSFLGLLLLC